MADRAGQQFGTYRLMRLLGTGHLTEVHLGEHLHTRSPAAIKILDTQLAGAEIDQFLVQAQALTQLQHANIVQIFDFGVEQGVPFVVMNYASQGTLRQLHPKGSSLPLATIVSYVEQIASALQYVHDRKLIHRDIKPHNILLGPANEIWLSDFDIAVVSQSMGYRRQKAQGFEGTVPYAAPEQLRGMPRIASDQYALAVMVYEWLSGTWPFLGTASEISRQHQVSQPPPLHTRFPGIPIAVEQVVLRALAKDPYERFESVLAFARALERASRLERSTNASTPTSFYQFKSPFQAIPFELDEPDEPDAATQPVILHTYHGHTARVTAVAWSPNGQFIASSSLDETVRVWEAATGNTLLTQRGNSLDAQAIAWSPDSRYLASTTGLLSESIQIWDAKTGQLAFTATPAYEGHSECVQVIAWSPDGAYLASGGDEKTIHVWEASTKRHIFTYRGHSQTITSLAWSPGGTLLASGSEEKTVHVWEATRGGNIRISYGHIDKITAVAWSPDGQRLASASADQSVRVWDVQQLQSAALSYHGHAGAVTSLAWSPGGTLIASASVDETVQVWDATSGNLQTTFRGHSDWVSTVSWAPHDEGIASGSWDKTVQVWQLA